MLWGKPIRDDSIYALLDYKDPNTIKIASKQFFEEFLYENF